MKLGIGQKILWAWNPLPVVTDEELLKRAKIEATPRTDDPFCIKWQYSGGGDAESISLDPGDIEGLREAEARDLYVERSEQGLVLLDDKDDTAERSKKKIEGLRAAIKFWRERGAPKLLDLRKLHGWTNDDLETRRYDLWAYHEAIARTEILEEALQVAQRKEQPERKAATA